MTCEYRCGNACSHEAPNTSGNAYFGDVVRSIVSRCGMLKAGAVLAVAAGAAVVGGVAAAVVGGVAAADDSEQQAENGDRHRRPRGMDFTPVAPNTADQITVPEGYVSSVVIGWGDAVLPGAPAFDFDNQTAAPAAKQFGFNNDFCGLVPLWRDQYLMVSSHEYSTESFMFKGYDAANPTEEQVKIGWAAHGMSVVVVERDRRSGKITPKMDRRHNRRITVNSAFDVDGPAAGSDFLKTKADPTGRTVFGTLNNCAGGVTPWGTILSGEENFNQYFGNGNQITDPVAKARLARYGLVSGASGRKWERFDDRFDIVKEPNEVNRFGWMVEIAPLEPNENPVKRTALGRFKHEGANIHVARDGRVVAYMGDDEPLANLRRVIDAVHRICDPAPEGLGISQRSVTVSTVGLVPAIRKLTDEGLQVRLAVSLHTPDDELRDTLVPVNNRWKVAEVLEAARDYADKTGRRVSIEYALIRDINDHPGVRTCWPSSCVSTWVSSPT